MERGGQRRRNGDRITPTPYPIARPVPRCTARSEDVPGKTLTISTLHGRRQQIPEVGCGQPFSRPAKVSFGRSQPAPGLKEGLPKQLWLRGY